MPIFITVVGIVKAAEIRQKFLDYFETQGHTVEPSASLVPNNDKTLLFVNAGMVPFKDVFNNIVTRPYKRAVSCQRCIRAGGKHNDLENVGYTARHHTFFEMLGNFSFGDYFKREAIHYAWDFLTKQMQLPADRLWVSVFEQDNEAEDIWINEIGFPKNRISRCGAKDNFWQMGDTGPCGPCSEIFYDHGADIDGGPPGHADEDGDRYIEIWNLVFTQFDRQADGYLKPLSAPCVDTGMGLERLAAVLQHQHNNYNTDIFTPLTKATLKLIGKGHSITVDNASIRVIADHIRATTFMLADGITPSNEGRGYVLRRIIRRAIRHGHKIGIDKVFFYQLAPVLAKQVQDIYPQLKQNLAHIEKILKQEETRFMQTLDQGMEILTATINQIDGEQIDGETIFKLYDTYGFPADLTADIAREHNLSIDLLGFENAMLKQKQRARQNKDFTNKQQNVTIVEATEFLGYQQLTSETSVQAIIKQGVLVQSISKGDCAIVILPQSSFYAESGGQVGDRGNLLNKTVDFAVHNTQKQASAAFEHHGELQQGILKVGDKLSASVDAKRRKCIMRNHSATHLLHSALRLVLGETISQKGSLVDADKLRFDFSHGQPIEQADLDKIEATVNQKILDNAKVHTDIMDIKSAKNKGALALFGEKYGDTVRVLTMGKNDFSVELCGGTHVSRLGDIGLFKITAETGIAAGIRRIEAKTGLAAYQFDKQTESDLNSIAKMLKTSSSKAADKVAQLISQQKTLEKQIATLQKQQAGSKSDELINKAVKIKGIQLISTEIKDISTKNLRTMMDKLKDKLKSAIIVLASVNDGKITLLAGVTNNLTDQYQAGKIMAFVAQQVGGKGGGRADMAQGGGNKPEQLNKALASVKTLL